MAVHTRKDTSVGGGEVLIQHPVQNVGDVGLERVPCAGVDRLLRHLPEGHIGALQTEGDIFEAVSSCRPAGGQEELTAAVMGPGPRIAWALPFPTVVRAGHLLLLELRNPSLPLPCL